MSINRYPFLIISFPEIHYPNGRAEPASPWKIQEILDDILSRPFERIEIQTYSPIVIDYFRDSPELLFVHKDDDIIPVTFFRKAEWLKQFNLGMLYMTGDFGQDEHPVLIRIKN